MDKSGKKRKKAYYVQQSNKKQCMRLDAGMKGFLLTCNYNEKRAVMESYSIFNEYADKLYGPESRPSEVNESADDNFEDEIRKEIEMAKAKGSTSERRFQGVDTKTTNCVFIKTTLESPNELISAFLADVYNTKQSKCRHILRIHPVLGTCKADVDKIEKLAIDILTPIFQQNSDSVKTESYCIVYKVRCNNLGREDILKVVGKVVHDINPSVKVNFDNPDVVVSVDVLQKFCCISVMRDYFKYRKYNVQELCKQQPASAVESQSKCAETATTSESTEMERNKSEVENGNSVVTEADNIDKKEPEVTTDNTLVESETKTDNIPDNSVVEKEKDIDVVDKSEVENNSDVVVTEVVSIIEKEHEVKADCVVEDSSTDK